MHIMECDLTPTRALLHREHVERRTRMFVRRIRFDPGIVKRISRPTYQRKPSVLTESEWSELPNIIAEFYIAPAHFIPFLQNTEQLEPIERVYFISEIRAAVAKVFGLSKIEILSDRRNYTIVRPRQIAMCICKNLTTKSLVAIGQAFGGRDHTTALHSVRKMQPIYDRIIATGLVAVTPKDLAVAFKQTLLQA